jgi:hypothetical protein
LSKKLKNQRFLKKCFFEDSLSKNPRFFDRRQARVLKTAFLNDNFARQGIGASEEAKKSKITL